MTKMRHKITRMRHTNETLKDKNETHYKSETQNETQNEKMRHKLTKMRQNDKKENSRLKGRNNVLIKPC